MRLANPLAVLALTIGVMATPAFAADPTGVWQSTTGESRYSVSLCGDGTELCAKMVWLRDDAKTAANLPYLGKYVVKGAAPSADDTWSGKLTYDGESYDGTVTMVDDNRINLSGCKGMFCQTMHFTRVTAALAAL